MSLQPPIKIAEAAARKAGQIIINAIEHIDTIEITKKARNDFATSVDRASEEQIIEILHKSYPAHHIIGEETGNHGPEDSDHVWMIDPLDGTTNYIHGFPHFAISIAMLFKGRVENALVYDPIRDEMFMASRGQGARMNGRRLRVSPQRQLEDALIGTGFPFKHEHHIEPYMKTFQALFPKTGGVRRAGSAALDLAYVAAGRLDGFWEICLNQWDMAAGALLVKEAGGLVSDFQGSENYLENGNIIAGNPKIFKSMLQIILPSLET